jgi:hypothetical protein
MESVFAIYCLCIDIYIVSTFLYETSTWKDRNNAIWDINVLFDAVFLFQSANEASLAISVEKMPQSQLDEKAYKAASWNYRVDSFAFQTYFSPYHLLLSTS